MTVREIIIAKLKEIGADGLCKEDNHCCCTLNDLMECQQQWECESCCDCHPSKRIGTTKIMVPMEDK